MNSKPIPSWQPAVRGPNNQQLLRAVRPQLPPIEQWQNPDLVTVQSRSGVSDE